jgi:hypothetical protein
MTNFDDEYHGLERPDMEIRCFRGASRLSSPPLCSRSGTLRSRTLNSATLFSGIRSSSCPGFLDKLSSPNHNGGRNGCYLLLNDRNNRNFGTLETCLSRKRFERSVAVERLERLERLERIDLGGFVLAGIKPAYPVEYGL